MGRKTTEVEILKEALDLARALERQLHRWRDEAVRAGRTITRIAEGRCCQARRVAGNSTPLVRKLRRSFIPWAGRQPHHTRF